MTTPGIVLRAFGDRTLVESLGEVHTLRPKGLLRTEGLLAGDRVECDGEHITKLLPRQNQLGRPPVANAAVVLVVVCLRDPAVAQVDIDRLILQAAVQELRTIVVLNKADLCAREEKEAFLDPYRRAGYAVAETAARVGQGIAELQALLPPGIAVLAGPSGVGKSSILKALIGIDVKVSSISERLHRGRHTTRAATLYSLGAGRLLADTPGFSALELPEVEARELKRYYPEFRGSLCRFGDCVHRAEPDCSVQEAVQEGTIDRGRYERYLDFLQELEGRPKRWH